MTLAILTAQHGTSLAPRPASEPSDNIIETRLWLEEHEWLYALLKSERNISLTFRFPDLISACVALVFAHDNAAARIFAFLGAELVLRAPQSPRRRESIWMPQYVLLQAVQRSSANRHPHPKFQLDQLTTACVALCRQDDSTGEPVLRQARINMAERITRSTACPPTS